MIIHICEAFVLVLVTQMIPTSPPKQKRGMKTMSLCKICNKPNPIYCNDSYCFQCYMKEMRKGSVKWAHEIQEVINDSNL